MKATAAVLSGKNEVYVKEVDLPEIGEEVCSSASDGTSKWIFCRIQL